MMTAEQAVLAAILLCVAGSVLTLLVSRNKTAAGWFAFLVMASAAALNLFAIGRVLMGGPSPHAATFWIVPQIGFALRIHVDGLTAVFLLVAAIVAVPASFYSIGYMRYYQDRGVARYYPYFLLMVAAIYGLFSTRDMVWFFIIFWQMMILSGYALIRFDNSKAENVRAANKFLIMMQIAWTVTVSGAWLLTIASKATHGDIGLGYGFDSLSANLFQVLSTRPGTAALAFGLLFVGFGINMRMWPFGQIWLPDAHLAAPSPVSAMLSGVMIKVGVYGMMRFFLWLVPVGARSVYPMARWGMAIAIVGTITLFTGTMQALKQAQTKRLLAFHSIGQIGYILLGTGTCMALLPLGGSQATAVAALAMLGALLHVVNHGLFKGLLFLNAGSMLYATGTQELDQIGGLMKFMPLTAVTALVASLSISGIPLFNSFVSKWAIYLAAIQGSASAKYLAVCAVVAILTSALTLASFVKFFGLTFLARTSALVNQQVAKKGRLEVPWLMQIPQVLLALLCILLGVVPALGFWLVQHALNASRQGFGATLADAMPLKTGLLAGVDVANSTALFVPLALVVVLGLMFLLSYGLSRVGGSTRRAAVPWLCGYVREAECHRYVAHNFYGEIKRYFGWLGGAPHPRPARPPAVKEIT